MQRSLLLIVILALSLFVVLWGYAAFVGPYPAGGRWGMMPNTMMGPGMWGGGGYGPRAMRGYAPDAVGPGWNTSWGDANLTADKAKNYFERWLAWQGNPRLKVGDVKERDADSIVVDIVTKDNSLVQRFVVNRRNGWIRPSED
jgi:hypothetical protein